MTCAAIAKKNLVQGRHEPYLSVQMRSQFPDPVKAVLWSYDLDKIDVEAHKERIITNVLNLGTHKAVVWLFATYPREQIAAMVARPRSGEWNRKSLNFWALVFGVEPQLADRFS